MNDQKPDNIVTMAAYKTQMNKLNSGSLELLHECRDLMTDRLSQSLSVILNNADDILFDMVQKCGPSEHHYYFNAMREVRLKRTTIEADFKDNFTVLFDKSVHLIENGQDTSTQKNTIEEIDIEETIALNSTVGKIRHDCHEALFALDQRMNELLSGVKVEKRLNPIRPETICTAFQEACKNIDSGIEIKLILFKLFEKYISSNLHKTYQDIDSLINEKKISALTRPNTNTCNQADMPETMQKLGTGNSGIIRDKNYFVIANRIIRNEITQHLGNAAIPEFVKDFLFNQWSKLLLKIYIKEGVDSKAWVHAIEVIDDLVRCLSEEISVQDRLGMGTVMPNLIQRLKYGMNVIPVTPVIREEFTAELKRHHQELIDNAKAAMEAKKNPGEEDVTDPSFRKTTSTPFMSELLADNKPGSKKDFDIE